MAGKNILVIDDEASIREFIKDFFEDRGFNVEIASDGIEGIDKCLKGEFDLVLTDMLMPKLIGLEVLRRIKAARPEQKVIVMTGVKERSMADRAKEIGCHSYLTKPIQLAELVKRVAECFPG